jgi:hypothetical protein
MNTTIAILPNGDRIDRHFTTNLVKWVIVSGKKKTLIQKTPRGHLVDSTEKFILSRFAVGVKIHEL